MPNKKINKVYEKLVDGVKNFRNTDNYIAFLKFCKNFHNYSFANKILIYNQFENATHVAGFKTWEKLGRTVKKGSNGIQILCPMPLKRKIKVTDKDTFEEQVKDFEFLSFRPAYVFDISQTEGNEVPELKKNLNTNNQEKLLKKLTSFSPFPIRYVNLFNGEKGYFHTKEKFIAISQSLAIDDKVSVLLHELTHGLYDDFNYSNEKELSEIFVESVAFIVADYFNLDTSICSFRYVNLWANNDIKKVIELGSKIQSTATSFIEKLEFSFSKGMEVV